MRTVLLCVLPHLTTTKRIILPLLHHATVVHRRAIEQTRTPTTVTPTPSPWDPPSNANSSKLISLYQGYGTHYVDLWVGTPVPQRQTVIVDTGSHVTAFPCEGCKDCGKGYHTDNTFNYEKSTSFQKLPCDDCPLGTCSQGSCSLQLSYTEGSSWNAFGARDKVYVGGKHNGPELHASERSFDLNFGCQTRITGLFRTQLADGIMGMSNRDGTFWQQMFSAGEMEESLFSLCFIRAPDVNTGGTMAGAMSMGGVDERLWETPLVYAKSPQDTGSLKVRVKGVYLWDQEGLAPSVRDIDTDSNIVKLELNENKLNSGQNIVDSGTTDTYLNFSIFNAMKKVWRDMVGAEFSTDNFSLTAEQLDKLPTIIVQLEGVNNDGLEPNTPGLAGLLDTSNPQDILIAIPPISYIEYISDADQYATRIYSSGRGNTFGANFMANHDVVFDIKNRRIGFAESSCDYYATTGDVVEPLDSHEVTSEQMDEIETEDSPIPTVVDSNETSNDMMCSSQTCQGVLGVFMFALVFAMMSFCKLKRNHRTAVPTEDDDDEVMIDDIYDTEIVVNATVV